MAVPRMPKPRPCKLTPEQEARAIDDLRTRGRALPTTRIPKAAPKPTATHRAEESR